MPDRVAYHRSNTTPGLVLGEARFSDFRFDRHYHLDYHVGLVTEGVQRQRHRGNTDFLAPGRISLMPPGEIHDGVCHGDSAYTLKTFRLSPELLGAVTAEIAGSTAEPALAGVLLENAGLAARLINLHSTMQTNADTAPLSLQSEWLTLFDHLFTQSRVVVPQSVKGTLPADNWRRVKDYCHAQLAQKISLDDLAALCGLERFHFLKLFKQTAGMTPHAWLVRLRVERAAIILHRTSRSIADVAQDVGFYDQSHFNRAFRRAFGVAPSRY
ncbi:AraC family transcriptional regulator [Burkholderia sp. Leaf177]|uniref:AraC family transcriptional regulator n=1 Tax=Burkholderia sp. Leaf177 TaxID=1736287 RepID=UPI0006F8357C|nr:AraC family transcriptional regulator [Burkholderia sp. Leaf177]KQR73843.1 AraC family transcriptional regulator [Burkholderia sp. Leaf177]